ncbi:MAG: hypothetical protein H6993_03020 [Pseudomonadales bacterium]|nr:hypothetical protein [Pseudomonadales bacterium]MCP5182903.1 hypothetical protein [Pseudomonadales bacterium]
MNRTILFLSDPRAEPTGDNHMTLPVAFRNGNWHVVTASHALSVRAGDAYAGEHRLKDFDLVWPLGLGPREGFLDRMQLLAHSDARLINPPSVYLLLHGKLAWTDLQPETHAADDWRVLADVVGQGGEWLLKPAAGSFGRDVTRIRPFDTAAVRSAMARSTDSWFVLQRWESAIAMGEWRSLLVGDRIIGSYRRTPTDGLRANLAAGGHATRGEPDSRNQAVVDSVRARLRAYGAGFAAIDTSGGFLVEVNVANPGGLGTLNSLHGLSVNSDLVSAIEAWLQRPTRAA